MKNTIYFNLKKQWYLLIKNVLKLQEYREIKPYWIVRIFRNAYTAHTDKQYLCLDIQKISLSAQ